MPEPRLEAESANWAQEQAAANPAENTPPRPNLIQPTVRPVMIVPDFDRTGGYERQAFFLARACKRAGVDTFILTNNPWHLPPREVRDGVTIHRLDSLPKHRCTFPNLYKSFLLFLLSNRRDFDVIHCHAFTFVAAFSVFVGKLLRKPTLVKVATERDIRQFHECKGIGFRTCYPLLRRADRLLSLSESIEKEFLKCGFEEKRILRMPNGVDTDHFQPVDTATRMRLRQELRLDPDTLHFLFIGRLVERKGVDLLLQAMRNPRLGQAKAIILGDGEEREHLHNLAARLGVIDRIVFAGEHAEIRPWLGAADVFVFPSRLEGLPNALLEAMSAGLPAIATRIGGCTDVIRDGTGVLVEPDNAEALGSAMQHIMVDERARKRLAVNARQHILKEFSFHQLIARFQDVYRDLLGRRSRKSQGKDRPGASACGPPAARPDR